MWFLSLIKSNQDGRSRHGSPAASPEIKCNDLGRVGTVGSLPPYSTSSPRPKSGQEPSLQRAKTPSDLLDLRILPSTPDVGLELSSRRSVCLPTSEGGQIRPAGPQQTSPHTLMPVAAPVRVFGRDEDVLKPLRPQLETETDTAIGSLGASLNFSSPPESSNKTALRSFSEPSSLRGLDFRRSAVAVINDSDAGAADSRPQDPIEPEIVMDNLRGVKVYVHDSMTVDTLNSLSYIALMSARTVDGITHSLR